MIVRKAEPLKMAVEGIPEFDDWISSVNTLQERRLEHPGLGLTSGIDLANDSHLVIQAELNVASRTESETRRNLETRIADRDFGDLDVIGKLAVLHALSSFMPIPSDKEVRSLERKEGAFLIEFPDGLSTRIIPGLAKVPKGSDGVFWHAGIIENALRVVDGALKDKTKVKVHESQLRHRLEGYRQRNVAYRRQIDTEGLVTTKHLSFPIEHPTVSPEGAISFSIPTTLDRVKITKQTGGNDHKKGGLNEIRHDVQYTSLRPQNVDGKKYISIPLIAVMRTLGEDVPSRYIDKPMFTYGREQNDITVTIGSTELSNDIV
jgi:hypothetical protein